MEVRSKKIWRPVTNRDFHDTTSPVDKWFYFQGLDTMSSVVNTLHCHLHIQIRIKVWPKQYKNVFKIKKSSKFHLDTN